jgi:large subunit ribosomal protein L35
MPKLKTHKGIKKRFKVSATGKVSHKRCGSSHLMSHKSGKQVRRLRKKSTLKIAAEASRLRRAVRQREGSHPVAIEAAKIAAMLDATEEGLLAGESEASHG